jgi:hypothetical protein
MPGSSGIVDCGRQIDDAWARRDGALGQHKWLIDQKHHPLVQRQTGPCQRERFEAKSIYMKSIVLLEIFFAETPDLY